jgi:hypothetical protein
VEILGDYIPERSPVREKHQNGFIKRLPRPIASEVFPIGYPSNCAAFKYFDFVSFGAGERLVDIQANAYGT